MPRRRSKTRKNNLKSFESPVSIGADGEDVDKDKSKDDISLNTSLETSSPARGMPTPQHSVESGDCEVTKAEFGGATGSQGKECEEPICVKDYSDDLENKTCAGDFTEPAVCRSGAESEKLENVKDNEAEGKELVVKEVPSTSEVGKGSEEESVTSQEHNVPKTDLVCQETENVSLENVVKSLIIGDESTGTEYTSENNSVEKHANELAKVSSEKMRSSESTKQCDDSALRSAVQEQRKPSGSKGQHKDTGKQQRDDQENNEIKSSAELQIEDIVSEGERVREHSVIVCDQKSTQSLTAYNCSSSNELLIKDIIISNNNCSERKLPLTRSETSSDTLCENKVSVSEIKRRFSCHSQKSSEICKLKISPAPTENEDLSSDSNPGRYKELGLERSTGRECMFTTEIYIAPIPGNESSCASLLSSNEYTSNTIVANETIKFKPKSASGLSHDIENLQSHADESMFNLRETKTPVKISVKQLRDRLISSCSTIGDKPQIEDIKQCDEIKPELKTNNENNLETHPKGYEKEGFNVSLKERLETYRCQASKAFHHIQSFYIEQELPTVTPIKELQLNFSKTNQPKADVTVDVNRSKVKGVNELVNFQSVSMKCKSCGKQVFLMERVMAEKALWHKKCFRCRECQRQLTVENYKSQDGELYCESHYNRILKPKPMDDAVSANSIMEEVKIPPLNLKPLFEKSASSSSSSPSSPSSPSIERSPRFLKRLAKFEGKCLDQSDEEEEERQKEKEPNLEVSGVSPIKISKVDDLETYLDEECRKKSEGNVAKGWKKSSSSISSPNSSCLRVHMKQFFDKTPNDSESTGTKHFEELNPSSKNLTEGSQICDVPKKVTQNFKGEDNTTDVHTKISRTLGEEADKHRCHSANDVGGFCEGNDIRGQARDVQSVISYFNKQQ